MYRYAEKGFAYLFKIFSRKISHGRIWFMAYKSPLADMKKENGMRYKNALFAYLTYLRITQI